MEKKEIMLEEVVDTSEALEAVDTINTEEGSGVAGAVLIGAVILGAGFALYKVGKKVWKHCKAKKAEEVEVIDPVDESELCDDENMEDIAE